LAAFLLSAHGLSLLAAWLNPLPVWLRLGLSVIILFSLWHLSRAKPQFVGLRGQADGSWLLQASDGTETEAALLATSIANPWFVLLHFRSQASRISLLVSRDSVEAEGFRRLRVALNIAKLDQGKDPLSP